MLSSVVIRLFIVRMLEYTRKSLSAKLLTLNEGIVDKVLNIDVICDV